VTGSLAVLVQYRLVKYNALETNENLAEYVLLHDRILLFLRYPRYVYFILKKCGNPAALLIEELLKSGVETAESLIIRAYSHSDGKSDTVLKELRDSFLDLVGNKYMIRSPEVSEDSVPQQKTNVYEAFKTPELDLKDLKTLIESGAEPTSNLFWVVNFDKFHQSFRDKILIDAIERQIDPNAGECFQYIIQLMYTKTDPWALHSNPISFTEIKQIIERKSNNAELVKFVEQYVSIIEKDECGFLRKQDEAGGGMYIVNMVTAFQQLAWAVIENVITQKFGSKATRIFRVVRAKKFIEQEDIQREAMIPGKEAKLFTYKLLEENLLQIQTIKKAGGGGMGPAKAFYLFRINQYHVS
jgi:DNA-directed RNA polymerase III subunit RPC3